MAIRETLTSSEAVPLDKMLENLTAYQPIELTPVPQNLRAISVKPRAGMQLQAQVLVGHDPMTRRIVHKMCAARSTARSPRSFTLPFPYGLFWFALHGNKLLNAEGDSIIWNPQGWGYVWMKEPFENLEQNCWSPAMPNIFHDSRICFGRNSIQGSLPLGHYIDQSVNTFWTSEFNQDLEILFPFPTMDDWAASNNTKWDEWDIWNETPMTLKNKFASFHNDMNWDDPVPSTSGASIPELPTFPTFDNLERWVQELNADQLSRMLSAVNQQISE